VQVDSVMSLTDSPDRGRYGFTGVPALRAEPAAMYPSASRDGLTQLPRPLPR
jgi:hypothetical protein